VELRCAASMQQRALLWPQLCWRSRKSSRVTSCSASPWTTRSSELLCFATSGTRHCKACGALPYARARHFPLRRFASRRWFRPGNLSNLFFMVITVTIITIANGIITLTITIATHTSPPSLPSSPKQQQQQQHQQRQQQQAPDTQQQQTNRKKQNNKQQHQQQETPNNMMVVMMMVTMVTTVRVFLRVRRASSTSICTATR
jgi:hypothetical protein